MSFEIIWTPIAEETFNNNLEYLYKEWNTQVINDFLNRVDEVINKIQSDPQLFPFYKKSKAIRKCVVTEQITLYYRSDNSKINLLTFWNVNQNPKRLKL